MCWPRNWARARPSPARAPRAVSRNIFSAPALASCATCAFTLWPSVDTRAQSSAAGRTLRGAVVRHRQTGAGLPPVPDARPRRGARRVAPRTGLRNATTGEIKGVARPMDATSLPQNHMIWQSVRQAASSFMTSWDRLHEQGTVAAVQLPADPVAPGQRSRVGTGCGAKGISARRIVQQS